MQFQFGATDESLFVNKNLIIIIIATSRIRLTTIETSSGESVPAITVSHMSRPEQSITDSPVNEGAGWRRAVVDWGRSAAAVAAAATVGGDRQRVGPGRTLGTLNQMTLQEVAKKDPTHDRDQPRT